MSYRFMRVLVMFDLPTESSIQRRNYRKFRKSLIKKWIYYDARICLCKTSYESRECRFNSQEYQKTLSRRRCSTSITNKQRSQFSKMEFLVGESQTGVWWIQMKGLQKYENNK